MKCALLVAGCVLALSALPARAASSLDEAFAAELRTLASERAALDAARVAARARRAERAAALRKEIVTLDARLLAASAEKEALRLAVASLEREALQSGSAPVDIARLKERLDQMEHNAQVSRVDTGFFDREGAWVNGTVLRLGSAAALGVSERAAGPLADVSEGGSQIAVASGAVAAAARAALNGGSEIALFFGRAPQDDPRVDAGLLDRLTRGGMLGAVVIVLALATLIFSFLRAWWLWRGARRARLLIDDVARRVGARELLEAFGRCRAATGPAAALLAAVVSELSTDPRNVEERASSQLLLAQDQIDRGRMLTMAGIAATLIGAALAAVLAIEQTLLAFAGASADSPRHLMDAIAAAISPATLALALALPTVLFAMVAAALAARLRTDLERGVLAILDAARDAEAAASAMRAGVTFLPPLGKAREASA